MIRAYADPDRQREGGRRSAEVRAAQAAAKRQVAAGQRPIAAVLADQDADLAALMLADLLLLVPAFGRGKLHALGRRACVANVNLMVTLGGASLRTRQWVSWEMTKNQAGMLDGERVACPHDCTIEVPAESRAVA